MKARDLADRPKGTPKPTIVWKGACHLVGKAEVFGEGRYASVALTTYNLVDGKAVMAGEPFAVIAADDDVILASIA